MQLLFFPTHFYAENGRCHFTNFSVFQKCFNFVLYFRMFQFFYISEYRTISVKSKMFCNFLSISLTPIKQEYVCCLFIWINYCFFIFWSRQVMKFFNNSFRQIEFLNFKKFWKNIIGNFALKQPKLFFTYFFIRRTHLNIKSFWFQKIYIFTKLFKQVCFFCN